MIRAAIAYIFYSVGLLEIWEFDMRFLAQQLFHDLEISIILKLDFFLPCGRKSWVLNAFSGRETSPLTVR